MTIEEQVPLAPLTTFGIGGPAQYFCRAQNERDIREAFAWARERGEPVFVLGGGSNVLIADRGIRGLTLLIELRGSRNIEGDPALVEVAAGEHWDTFVACCVERGLAGVECLSGIPGRVGGTPVQNVGAYGQEVSETITGVRAFDTASEEFVELSPEHCGFGYRTSVFNTTARNRYIVTAVRFALRRGGVPTLRYPELRRTVGNNGSGATLAEVRNTVREIRHRKAMLIVEGEPECRSAGSFFKNPIVSESLYSEVERRAGEAPPRFPIAAGVVGEAKAEGTLKIPAAWLIEHAGFHKGYRPQRGTSALAPVGISSRHALALVNYGDGKAADVLELKREIQEGVEQRFGIWLQPEPVFAGFQPGEVD